MTNEQRTKLSNYWDQMCDLTEQITKLCTRAEATGDLKGELEGRWGAIIFNMGRAGDAALNAIGELAEPPKLPIQMTDPDEIIKRCEMLIPAAEEYIFDVQFAMSK